MAGAKTPPSQFVVLLQVLVCLPLDEHVLQSAQDQSFVVHDGIYVHDCVVVGEGVSIPGQLLVIVQFLICVPCGEQDPQFSQPQLSDVHEVL